MAVAGCNDNVFRRWLHCTLPFGSTSNEEEITTKHGPQEIVRHPFSPTCDVQINQITRCTPSSGCLRDYAPSMMSFTRLSVSLKNDLIPKSAQPISTPNYHRIQRETATYRLRAPLYFHFHDVR